MRYASDFLDYCCSVLTAKLTAVLLRQKLKLQTCFGLCIKKLFCFQALNETALHLAISEEDNRSLYMVDFIMQNTSM